MFDSKQHHVGLGCSTSTTSAFNNKNKPNIRGKKETHTKKNTHKKSIKKKHSNFQNLKLGSTKEYRKNFSALIFHLLNNLQFCLHLRTSCFGKDKVVRAIKHPDGKIFEHFFLPAFSNCFGFLTDCKADSLPQKGSQASNAHSAAMALSARGVMPKWN